ncbi:protein phosphatase 1 regulatory subunit 26 isoform X2 [Gopherus flavomarginatus]|uniref:protein phosphatase 1 regulatory subunit 26 isoform X2 n=1 Tax=Gopherus flavomarginatus TaxID=286002 RepID=UPI0021CBD434|nr:protein phosphatase 1 regulatory subunit 26 isoform X2 [Gopherus flavomarginatus]
MFLMNASPLIALKTKWESFGQSRSCRYPVCFSESEEDVTRASVSAKVQMIINNLQSQESSLDMNNDYDCITQKKRKGEKRSNRLTSSTRVLQQHTYSKCGCPADSDGTEVEDSSEFGTLLLDSDSDDSVDRDIEEAIQEYLKKKSKSIQPLPSNAECSDRTDVDKRVKRELSQNKVTSNLLPMKFKAEMVTEGFISDHVGICEKLRSASPLSISSDDSFEQSIHAEIVQFLNEKKQQETNKCVIVEDKNLEQKETQVKSMFKYNKESANKANRSTLKQGCKALLLRHQPKLRKTNVQSKCLKSKISEEPSDFSKATQTHFKMTATSQPWVVEQNKEGEGKRHFFKTEGEQIIESTHLSDSSSDDGIEEAIQLYQLEKIKKEVNPTTDFQKGVADISASLTISSTKCASAEDHKKSLSSKRREMSTKSTQFKGTGNEFNKLFKPLKKARSCASPVNKIAKCKLTLQASCRADTSTELMCAEAILDISKTIMPPQMGCEGKSFAANPFFYPQSLPSSHCESDSSPVDSDDSIEQEIRAFLALKAQSENLVTKPDNLSHSVQRPLSSERNSVTGGLEPSLPKTLNLSLSRKRRLKGESKVAKQSIDNKTEGLEMGYAHAGYGNSAKMLVLQDGSGLSCHRKACEAGRSGNKETSQQLISAEFTGLVDKHVALDFANSLMQVQGNTRELIKNTVQAQERDGTDDKSSSLDSDEDLDSAIKDLLRSKRKLKKKSKDQKIQCKKKVRFGDTETQLLDELSSLQRKDWKCKSPILLKSCLSKSRKDTKENAVRSPQNNVNGRLSKGRSESIKDLPFALQFKKECKPKPVCNKNNLEAAKNKRCSLTATSATDDSSSVDSDDSIEQEIRKFLAEKAKGSANSMEIRRDNLPADSLRVTKPRANKGKTKHQLIENETNMLSGQSKKTKKVPQQTDELKSSQRTVGESAIMHDGEKSASHAENVFLHTTLELKAEQGTVWTKGLAAGALSVKGNPLSKKSTIEPKQKSLSSTHSKGDGCKLQNYFNAKSNSKRNSTFQLKISSKFIAGLKYARDRKKSVLLNKRQNVELPLPHSSTLRTEVTLPNICALEQKSGALVQNGDLGGEGKTGIKEANFTQSLIVEETGLHIAETCEKLEAAPLHVKTEADDYRKDNTLGDKHMYCSSDSNPDPQLQKPNMAAVSVSVGTCIFESQNTSIKEEEGESQQDSSRQEEINVPNSSLEGKMLAEQSREADRKEDHVQETLDRSSAEFSDIAVQACTSSLVKSEVSDFSLRTSIDPGLTIQPYITLSPAQICKNLTLKIQNGRREFQKVCCMFEGKKKEKRKEKKPDLFLRVEKQWK